MEVSDYIVEGLIEYLELERELGARVVECDRALFDETFAKPEAGILGANTRAGGENRSRSTVVGDSSNPNTQTLEQPKPPNSPNTQSPDTRQPLDFVFLHDRPLSPRGVEMMAKIITALGKTADTAPVVIEKPIPKAKAYVVLGGLALRKFLPGKKGEPGQWIKSESGRDVLVTYSPEYILRFATVTPAVAKIKQDMWQALKSVKQRTA